MHLVHAPDEQRLAAGLPAGQPLDHPEEVADALFGLPHQAPLHGGKIGFEERDAVLHGDGLGQYGLARAGMPGEDRAGVIVLDHLVQHDLERVAAHAVITLGVACRHLLVEFIDHDDELGTAGTGEQRAEIRLHGLRPADIAVAEAGRVEGGRLRLLDQGLLPSPQTGHIETRDAHGFRRRLFDGKGIESPQRDLSRMEDFRAGQSVDLRRRIDLGHGLGDIGIAGQVMDHHGHVLRQLDREAVRRSEENQGRARGFQHIPQVPRCLHDAEGARGRSLEEAVRVLEYHQRLAGKVGGEFQRVDRFAEGEADIGDRLTGDLHLFRRGFQDGGALLGLGYRATDAVPDQLAGSSAVDRVTDAANGACRLRGLDGDERGRHTARGFEFGNQFRGHGGYGAFSQTEATRTMRRASSPRDKARHWSSVVISGNGPNHFPASVSSASDASVASVLAISSSICSSRVR